MCRERRYRLRARGNSPIRPHRRDRLGQEHGRAAVPAARRARPGRGRSGAGRRASRDAWVYRDRGALRRRRPRRRRRARPKEASPRAVFGDDEARRALNAITHPRIAALLGGARAGIRGTGRSPRLLRGAVVLRSAPRRRDSPRRRGCRIRRDRGRRAAARDGSTPDEVRARVRAQMPLEEKISRADYVIDNSGSLEATIARADEVLDAVCRSFEIDPRGFPRF